MTSAGDEPTLFAMAGGFGFFERVVGRFYDAVESDPILLPLYPEGAETEGARRRLTLFLAQYWGGPDIYSQERGHPRLRMRHVPYVIGELERDRWLLHMISAIEAETASLPSEIGDQIRASFTEYVAIAADHLRNS